MRVGTWPCLLCCSFLSWVSCNQNGVVSELDHLQFLSLQLKRVMESDSALTEDLIAYNIIPLDAASSTNAIVSFPEVFEFLFLRSQIFAIFFSTHYLKIFIVRCKQQFPLWSISVACRNCPGAISFLLQGMLSCLIFCSILLDFRSVC